MTTTDTAPPPVPVRELTHAKWFAEGKDLFGNDLRTWAFQCPTCGAVATPADFPPGLGESAPVECLGRHGAEGRCKRVAYGLIPGPWFVSQADGTVVSCFPFAAPSQPPQSAAQNPAAPVDHPDADSPAHATAGPAQADSSPSLEAPGAYWSVEHGWTDEPRYGCSCHISAPCGRCASLTPCPDCPTEVLVLEDEMDAHMDEIHPAATPLPSQPYLTSDDAESEA